VVVAVPAAWVPRRRRRAARARPSRTPLRAAKRQRQSLAPNPDLAWRALCGDSRAPPSRRRWTLAGLSRARKSHRCVPGEPKRNRCKDRTDEQPGARLRPDLAGADATPGAKQQERGAEHGEDEIRVDAHRHGVASARCWRRAGAATLNNGVPGFSRHRYSAAAARWRWKPVRSTDKPCAVVGNSPMKWRTPD